MGFVSGDRTRRRSCLLRGQHKHGRAEAPQQQAPPDMRTGQSAKACLRREVPTDHEARGQAQRRQLRRVATELRRDHDPEARAKHAKHDRIRTQADHQSRMTSVRGKQNDLHAQSLEGIAGGAGQSSKPTSTTTSQSSRALEKRAEENMWVSTWTSKQLVETRARVKRRQRAMECHGWRLMECHDDRKRRARESNVALQDLEKTTLSTRAARGGERQWCWETTRPRASEHVKRTRPDWMMPETRSQKLGQGQRTVYEQAKKLRSRTP